MVPFLVLASIFSVTQNLGYPLLGVVVGIEALGVPLPGETAVIFGGLAASNGRLDIVLVIVVAAAGAIIGDNIGFEIGRRGGRALLERPGRFYEERQRVLKIGDPFFERHGSKAVFLGRWIAGLRVWASWLAGASSMRWRTFFLWNALGGICWATSVSLAAYFGGTAVERVFSRIGVYAIIVVGAVVVAGGGYLLWRRRRRRRERGAQTPAPGTAARGAARPEAAPPERAPRDAGPSGAAPPETGAAATVPPETPPSETGPPHGGRP